MKTAVPLLLAALLSLGACSSDAEPQAGNSEPAAGSAPGDMLDGAFAARGSAKDSAQRGADAAASESAEEPASDEIDGRAVISTGVVSLRDRDVARARFEVQKIIDTHRGEIAEEKTQTDDDGAVSRSRLVVRVPVADFDATIQELEDVAELESSSRSSEDVTTTVIDNQVRIRAQTASLERIEVLLGRATSIRDIVSIEAQLTRRQAELDSLKQRQAYLADQTSLSTITVFLEQKPDPAATKQVGSEKTTGFLAGLGSGWGALKTFGTGVATVAGALLPFAALFALLGVPALLLLRRLAGRRPTVAPAGASDQIG